MILFGWTIQHSIAITDVTNNLKPIVYKYNIYYWKHSQTCIRCSLIQNCVCILQVHTYLAIGMQLSMTTKLRYLVTETSRQMTALLPMMHCFMTTVLTTYTKPCSVFSINHICCCIYCFTSLLLSNKKQEHKEVVKIFLKKINSK